MIYKNQYTNEEFQTQEACERSEAIYLENKELAEQKEKKEKAAISKRKKELSDAIASADKVVDAANKDYDLAKEKATKIIKEANKQAEEILREAAKALESATEARMLKIKEWCKEFGAYNTHYTGEDATEAYNRMVRLINDAFTNLFRF